MKRHWARVATIPVALALLVAACGDDDDSGGAATTAAAGDAAPTTAASSGDTATTEASSDTESTEGDTATTSDEGASTPAGGTQDFDGAEVTITGSERDDPSVIAINTVLDGVRRGEQHRRSPSPVTPTGKRTSTPRSQGGNPPTSASSRSRASSPTSPAPAPIYAARRPRSPAPSRRTGRPTTRTTPNVDGVQYGVPGQDRPQVARVVPAGALRGRRLRGARRRSTSSPR